jgi:D-glycero-alpha-D-manno-heptose-7-phosphate kinase
MLVSKTPLRISLFGGGTDFPEYFNNKKTFIVGGSINKYVYITLLTIVKPFVGILI